MVRVRCENCGQFYPKGAGHRCGEEPQANDNHPFDEKAWRRGYMAEYMRKRRLLARQAKTPKPLPA